MNQFFTLYKYELMKILKRRTVKLSMAVLLFLVVYMGIGEALSNAYSITVGDQTINMNGFEMIAKDKESALRLTGVRIDEATLKEVEDAYGKAHIISYEESIDADKMSLTKDISASAVMIGEFEEKSPEEQEAQQKKKELYANIYHYIYQALGSYDAVNYFYMDEAFFYQSWHNRMLERWMEQNVTQEEITYLTQREETIEKPFVYGYSAGWDNILREILSLNVMLVLCVGICLSNAFSEEHLRKTDQLILCSKLGKKTLYFAKMAAGATFGFVSSLLMLSAAALSNLCVYGAEGFDVAVQIYLPECARNLTMGQAVMILSAVYMAAAVFLSIVTLFLSEALKNSVAVMGLMTGCMILTNLVNIPYRFRVFSQLYGLIPTVLLRVWQLWDDRLVRIFGVWLNNFQIAPVLYLIVSILLLFLGGRIYRNYQVSGR